MGPKVYVVQSDMVVQVTSVRSVLAESIWMNSECVAWVIHVWVI